MSAEDVRDWLEDMCFHTLIACVEEAEQAFVKKVGKVPDTAAVS